MICFFFTDLITDRSRAGQLPVHDTAFIFTRQIQETAERTVADIDHFFFCIRLFFQLFSKILIEFQTVLLQFYFFQRIIRSFLFLSFYHNHRTVLIFSTDSRTDPFFFPFFLRQCSHQYLIEEQKLFIGIRLFFFSLKFCASDSLFRCLVVSRFFFCLFQLFFRCLKKCIQTFFIQCILQNIFVCAFFHCLFHVIKLVMTAKYDHINFRVILLNLFDQFNPIHQRPRNVCDN